MCFQFLFNFQAALRLFRSLCLNSSAKNFGVGLLCSSARFTTKMDAFTKEKIIPEVIDGPPMHLLKVSFGSIDVKPGMVLTPTQVKSPPKLDFPFEKESFYTIIMTDPDAPSRRDPKFREWHHWMVINSPGPDHENGEPRSEYVGSGPPKGTGLHRYVLLVYKQPSKMDCPKLPKLSNRSGEGRGCNSVRKILETAGMKGAPLVAANFYQAEFDDYVPKLYEQLSGK